MIDAGKVKLHCNNKVVIAAWGEYKDNLYMVKFDRNQVINMLAGLDGCVELKLTAEAGDIIFEGRDAIRVIPYSNRKMKTVNGEEF